MNDRIPGTTYSNPIWYRKKWRIFMADCGPFVYQYLHDDYDGEGDKRSGYAHTIEECKAEIDEIEDENHPHT